MRKSLAILAALGVFGALSASAATLGGLNSANLGADQTVVSSCDTDGIALSYTNAYVAGTNAFNTNAVTLTGVNAACTGQNFELVLSNGTAGIATMTGKVATVGGVQTVTLTTPVKAADVTAASLVIAG